MKAILRIFKYCRKRIIALSIENRQLKLQNEYLKTVDIGSYPFFRLGKVGVSIVLSSQSKTQLEACSKKFINFIKNKKIKRFQKS